MIQSTGMGTYFCFSITVEGAKKRKKWKDQRKPKKEWAGYPFPTVWDVGPSSSQFATPTSIKRSILDCTALLRPGDGDCSSLIVMHRHKITVKSGDVPCALLASSDCVGLTQTLVDNTYNPGLEKKIKNYYSI